MDGLASRKDGKDGKDRKEGGPKLAEHEGSDRKEAVEFMSDRSYGGKGTRVFSQLGGFRNLLVWQRADDLAAAVHQVTVGFGSGYYRLADQMRSAASSVPANVAEGYARMNSGDYVRFCEIARGSLAELGTYFQQCERWGLVNDESLANLTRLYGETSYLLNGLLRSLWGKRRAGDWERGTREETAYYATDPLPQDPVP